MKLFPRKEEQESLQAVQGEKIHATIKNFANLRKHTHTRERDIFKGTENRLHILNPRENICRRKDLFILPTKF